MNGRGIFLAVLLGILFVSANAAFVVQQHEQALVLRFGKVNRDQEKDEIKLYGPGLHFKWPMAEQVLWLDARVQTLEGKADRISTSEKKELIVDSYVKWRVSDYGRFYLRTTGDYRRAEVLLSSLINKELRSEFGKRAIKDVVSGSRAEVMVNLKNNVNRTTPQYGIEIVDVRIKKINLPDQISESVYNRMRAERQLKAMEHRSNGRKQADILQAKADRNVTILKANAQREARQIRGAGDAESARIYADVYRKNPDFFAFLRSLDAYRTTFKEQRDIMVITPDSEYFNYFKSMQRSSGKKN